MFSWLGKIFGGGGRTIVDGATDLVQTFTGDKASREEFEFKENIARQQAFAAEFMYRSNRTWWDSLIDGFNRLPRPVMTFGVIYLFYLCVMDPESFQVSMAALTFMPDYGWALMGTIVAFWFGGKFLSKDLRISTADKAIAAAIIAENLRHKKKSDTPVKDYIDDKRKEIIID